MILRLENPDEDGNVTFSDKYKFADQNMYSPDGEQTEKRSWRIEETKDEPQEPNPDFTVWAWILRRSYQRGTAESCLEQLVAGIYVAVWPTQRTQQLAENDVLLAAKGQLRKFSNAAATAASSRNQTQP